MKKLLLLFFVTIFSSSAFSQISKGQWLTGGSLGFSFTQTGSSNLPNLNSEFILSASPNVGYFFIDGLAIGARGQLIKDNYQQTLYGNTIDITQLLGNIFIRYYFLPPNSPVNIIIEGGGGLGSSSINTNNTVVTQNVNNLFLSVGPEIFLNPNTGFEILFSYRRMTEDGSSFVQSGIFFSVGFQIHLGKGAAVEDLKNKQMKPKHAN